MHDSLKVNEFKLIIFKRIVIRCVNGYNIDVKYKQKEGNIRWIRFILPYRQ